MSGQFFISFLNPIIALSCAAVLWLLERRWPGHTYLTPLGLAFFYAGVGFISQDFFGLSTPGTINFAGNVLFYMSVLLACASAVVRARLPLPYGAYAAIVAVSLCLFCWFAFVHPSTEARIVHLHLAFSAMALVTLVRIRRRPTETVADRLIVAALILASLLSLVRPILVVFGALAVDGLGGFGNSEYWATIRAFTPILALALVSVFLAAMAFDIHSELKSEAEQDFLTKLLNRRGFDAAANRILAQGPHRGGALLVADIDNFKAINDTFGHSAGDEVIAAVARTLDRYGEADVAGRIGGEEFALFYGTATRQQLRRVAEDVQARLRRAILPGLPSDYPLTISVGLHMQAPGEVLSDMMEHADRALYEAKGAGKDQVVVTKPRLRSV